MALKSLYNAKFFPLNPHPSPRCKMFLTHTSILTNLAHYKMSVLSSESFNSCTFFELKYLHFYYANSSEVFFIAMIVVNKIKGIQQKCMVLFQLLILIFFLYNRNECSFYIYCISFRGYPVTAWIL